ncbi:MAG: tetratricopeptide repeat protein [Nitrospira sp.]|nr:tetratricopeptide repeat protein [Nitrospira sp.]
MGDFDHLIEVESEARDLLVRGEYRLASELFLKIVTELPEYEHGFCFYDLAICMEELGEFEAAERYYLQALAYQPDDSIRLGGYASFLYLHGNPRVAFYMHLRLLFLERTQLDPAGADKTLTALRTLAQNLHMPQEEFVRLTGSHLSPTQ